MIQGSEDWHKARLGKITASRFKDVLAKGRGGEEFGKTALKYAYEKASEIRTGKPTEDYINTNMERGLENEPFARVAYEEYALRKVHEVGFIEKDDMVGGSPDGLVCKDGIIEIKCPLAHIHEENIHKKRIPSEYVPQIQGLLWITKRSWCDFISYHENYDRPLVIRTNRDEKYIRELIERIEKFKEIISEILERSRA